MSLKVEGSVVMDEVLAFHDRFVKAAARVDLTDIDVPYDSICTNIGKQCLVYALGDRRVEVSVEHVNMQLAYYLEGTLILESTFPQRELDAQINGALRWLVGKPVSLEPLPLKDVRIESPEDGKDYASVDLVVEINSTYESHSLWKEFKAAGINFVSDTGGPLKLVGRLARHEIRVSPLIHVIGGVRVLYIQPTTAVVDWNMIEEWVKQRVPKGTEILTGPEDLMREIRSKLHVLAMANETLLAS